ncbi:MAG: DUF3606 domain-containing protein [Bacteroidota bacterium]
MTNNEHTQENTDPGKVQLNDEYEFEYLERKINVDRNAIREAIEQVGNDREKVEEYLTNNRGL